MVVTSSEDTHDGFWRWSEDDVLDSISHIKFGIEMRIAKNDGQKVNQRPT